MTGQRPTPVNDSLIVPARRIVARLPVGTFCRAPVAEQFGDATACMDGSVHASHPVAPAHVTLGSPRMPLSASIGLGLQIPVGRLDNASS
jgi:hypothetical protein